MFKRTDAPVKHITEPKKKFLVSITYSVMLSCSLIIDIKKEKKTRGNYVLIIIITLKVTTIIFSLFDKVLLFIHVTIKKKRERKIKVLLNVNKTPTNSDILCFIAKY